MESVLNTLQLNSRTYFGVCWLKVAEIAEQSNVSKRTVQRVLKEFNDEGLVTVHSQIDIKRGGKSANVYVINCMTDSTY
ncbi:helix-turn-helix domain-containing protein [Paenibacillus pasadenensis]|uniref:helix-turn-helix domain-containing protein n=1 Tax=Paenibacillus pasadenensis TaxID=217090 RepID=UPI003CC82AD7